MNADLLFRFRILLQTQLLKTDVSANLAVRLMDQSRFLHTSALDPKLLDKQVMQFFTYCRGLIEQREPERPSWLTYIEVLSTSPGEIHAEFLTLVQTYVIRHRGVPTREATSTMDQAFFVSPACLTSEDLDRQAIEFCQYMAGGASRPFWVRYTHEES